MMKMNSNNTLKFFQLSCILDSTLNTLNKCMLHDITQATFYSNLMLHI